ncbi:MAG: NAD(P)-binding domain-containing protein [Rhizobiales bacterium]|nr:NAD(P)-binding domain-containing protein [Hyphomicrobiales bacterium]
MPSVHKIGILGAGRVGTALARLALAAGYEVSVATARPPAEIALLLEIMAPGAKPETAEALVASSNIVILALPLSKYATLRPDLFAGKIVIDAMNYWPPVDGAIAEFEGVASSSEIIQRHLPGALLVRSFNHMGYHEIEQEARRRSRPSCTGGRRRRRRSTCARRRVHRPSGLRSGRRGTARRQPSFRGRHADLRRRLRT